MGAFAVGFEHHNYKTEKFRQLRLSIDIYPIGVGELIRRSYNYMKLDDSIYRRASTTRMGHFGIGRVYVGFIYEIHEPNLKWVKRNVGEEINEETKTSC